MNETILNQLAILNTKTYPYEWSIPQVSALNSSPPESIQLHSATLIENYMFINFGKLITVNTIYIQLFKM
jgi:hypothetical protein